MPLCQNTTLNKPQMLHCEDLSAGTFWHLECRPSTACQGSPTQGWHALSDGCVFSRGEAARPLHLRMKSMQCSVPGSLTLTPSPFSYPQEQWKSKRGFQHFSIVRKLDGHPFPAGVHDS